MCFQIGKGETDRSEPVQIRELLVEDVIRHACDQLKRRPAFTSLLPNGSDVSSRFDWRPMKILEEHVSIFSCCSDQRRKSSPRRLRFLGSTLRPATLNVFS